MHIVADQNPSPEIGWIQVPNSCQYEIKCNFRYVFRFVSYYFIAFGLSSSTMNPFHRRSRDIFLSMHNILSSLEMIMVL